MKHKWILSFPKFFNIPSRKGICSLSSSKFLLTKQRVKEVLPLLFVTTSSRLPFLDSSFKFYKNCRTSQVSSSLQFTRQCSKSNYGYDILPNIATNCSNLRPVWCLQHSQLKIWLCCYS